MLNTGTLLLTAAGRRIALFMVYEVSLAEHAKADADDAMEGGCRRRVDGQPRRGPGLVYRYAHDEG